VAGLVDSHALSIFIIGLLFIWSVVGKVFGLHTPVIR